jgi:hypothetical protein
MSYLSYKDDDTVKVLFKGEHKKIYFVGRLPSHVSNGGPRLMTFYLNKNKLNLGYRLISTDRNIEHNYNKDFKEITLLEAIDELSFHYFDSNSNNWLTHWEDKSALPTAIKISWKYNNDGLEKSFIIDIPASKSLKTNGAAPNS